MLKLMLSIVTLSVLSTTALAGQSDCEKLINHFSRLSTLKKVTNVTKIESNAVQSCIQYPDTQLLESKLAGLSVQGSASQEFLNFARDMVADRFISLSEVELGYDLRKFGDYTGQKQYFAPSNLMNNDNLLKFMPRVARKTGMSWANESSLIEVTNMRSKDGITNQAVESEILTTIVQHYQ